MLDVVVKHPNACPTPTPFHKTEVRSRLATVGATFTRRPRGGKGKRGERQAEKRMNINICEKHVFLRDVVNYLECCFGNYTICS